MAGTRTMHPGERREAVSNQPNPGIKDWGAVKAKALPVAKSNTERTESHGQTLKCEAGWKNTIITGSTD